MVKSVVSRKFFARTLIVAGIIIAGSIVSCKSPEDCGAYQGSKKSNTRSYKHKKAHRHASASSFHNAAFAA
jgi:hypothetical protein